MECIQSPEVRLEESIMSQVPKPKVLVTHAKTQEVCLRILREKCDVIICESLPRPTREEILSKSKGVDGILWATLDRLDDEALDRAGPQLKVISTKSAGLDFVNVEAVKRRGIALGYTPEVLNDAVADLTVGLMLAAARRFREGYLKIVNDKWKLEKSSVWMLGRDIKGSTVGIVGLGRIGQVIVKRLKGFEVGTFLYSGNTEKTEGKELGATFLPFDELIIRSDFVIVVCPLTNQTRNMFNKSVFEKMKPTSVFVNVARGGIVVQDDLIDALKNGTIFAAGLDVMEPEPLPHDHPLVSLENCVLTPHIGSATGNTRNAVSTIAAQNIINGIEGKPMIYSAY